MKLRIVADSSCDLPQDFIKEDDCVDFSVVPLTIHLNDKEYVDDEKLDMKEFIAAMKASKTTGTACPAPEKFAREFCKNDESIGITISKNLSGTYNSAMMGREMAKEENPNAKCEVVDSMLTSGGMILMIMKIKEYVKAGLSYETVVEKLREYQKTLHARFVLQDLGNLVKAGRMSKVAGVFASALSLCPVCGDNGNGEIVVFEKVRGAKTAISRLADTVAEKVKKEKDFPIVITHCDNEEQALHLKKLLDDRFGLKDVKVLHTRGLAGFYANHKGIIMCF